MGASRTSVCSTSPLSSAPLSGSGPKSLATGACSISEAVMSLMRWNHGVRPRSSVTAISPSLAYSAAPKRLGGPSLPVSRSRFAGIAPFAFV